MNESSSGVDTGALRELATELTSARPGWDPYFIQIARAVALRGDCTRRQVGCVIVDSDHRVISTGYNGAEPGGPSCLAGQCPRGLNPDAPRTEDYSNCIAIHAEANALLFARTSCKGATAYITARPCDGCSKLLRGAGISQVVVDASAITGATPESTRVTGTAETISALVDQVKRDTNQPYWAERWRAGNGDFSHFAAEAVSYLESLIDYGWEPTNIVVASAEVEDIELPGVEALHAIRPPGR